MTLGSSGGSLIQLLVELKVKLMEEFEEQVPDSLNFSVGYFEGRQSTKKWIVTQEDLHAMYAMMNQAGKTDVCLWCDGREDEGGCRSRKRKRDGSSAPSSKRAEKEKEVEDIAVELRALHGQEKHFSDPQYRLWARMIVNGIHTSKETPPNVPMITGITPTRSSRASLANTVESTVGAVMKAIASQSLQNQGNTSMPSSPSFSQSSLGVSPAKAVDIRGKCFSQLASLKKLHEDSILTDEELKEQKECILETLRKLN